VTEYRVWHWTRRILSVAGLSLIAASVSGASYQWFTTRRDLAAVPAPGRLVQVEGRTMHIWCSGSGGPTVILETGLGGTTADWGFVQPKTARFTRVCSYDRAGVGYSDPGRSPRTARRIAYELAQLTDRSGIGGPLVLVGASIGGFAVRAFASEYPERAAGLVLVDATHEDELDPPPALARFVPLLSSTGVLRLLGVSFGPSPESLAPSVRKFARATQFRAAAYNTVADEIVHAPESAAEVRATRRPLAIPIVVVTSGRGPDRRWRELQHDQVQLSRRGCQMTADESGHVVAVDQPRVVVDAIHAVVDAVRTGHDDPLCG
jgi:pimeloyl-ACP methyl ester carboxylesterase